VALNSYERSVLAVFVERPKVAGGGLTNTNFFRRYNFSISFTTGKGLKSQINSSNETILLIC
jgi:hypothetical protein